MAQAEKSFPSSTPLLVLDFISWRVMKQRQDQSVQMLQMKTDLPDVGNLFLWMITFFSSKLLAAFWFSLLQ